jgi:hypothetical protein
MCRVLASENKETDEYKNAHKRNTCNRYENRNDPRLGPVGGNAIEDVSKSGCLALVCGVSQNGSSDHKHRAEKNRYTESEFSLRCVHGCFADTDGAVSSGMTFPFASSYLPPCQPMLEIFTKSM